MQLVLQENLVSSLVLGPFSCFSWALPTAIVANKWSHFHTSAGVLHFKIMATRRIVAILYSAQHWNRAAQTRICLNSPPFHDCLYVFSTLYCNFYYKVMSDQPFSYDTKVAADGYLGAQSIDTERASLMRVLFIQSCNSHGMKWKGRRKRYIVITYVSRVNN